MNATSIDPEATLHELAQRRRGEPRRRLLMIVNPYATTVSGRLKTSSSRRCAAATRSTRSTPSAATTPPSCAARPQRGLRRGRRVRRRRHRERGCQRPRRHRHAADLPARRPRERLLPDARDPGRRRRRDRAPAVAGRQLAHPRRSTSAASATATSCSRPASGSTPSVVQHVDAHPRLKARLGEYYYAWVAARDVLTPLPVAPAAARGSRSAGEAMSQGRDRAGPERLPVHLLRRPRRRDGRGRVARQRRPRRAGPEAHEPARHSVDPAGARCPRTAGSPTTARSSVQRADASRWSARSTTARCPLQVDGDYIGTVDELEFSVVPGALQVLA